MTASPIDISLTNDERNPFTTITARPSAMGSVLKDALLRTFGSLKAAAITMEIDQSQLTRDLQSGALKFERLERLDAAQKAAVVKRLADEFVTAEDPRLYAHRLVRDIRQRCDELEQALEYGCGCCARSFGRGGAR